MMKNISFAATAATAAAVVLLCGCQHTHVDQVRASDGMQDWYDDIKSNYPGFKPPRLVSPGISGNAGNQAVQEAQPAPETAGTEVKTDDADSRTPEVDVVATEVTPAPETAPAPAPAPEAKPAPEVKPAPAPAAEANKPQNAPEPPDPTGSQIYVVKSGDILSAISVKFYGSARYVNLIKKANSDIITNANVLKPGMKLIIPKL